MVLEPLVILNGTFSIILVSIYALVGIRIALKYRENKEKIYLYFGLTWIGMVEAWYAGSISFIIALFNDVGLPPEIYFIIGVGFYPIISVIWILAFTELLYKKQQKLLLIIFIIIGFIYEIIFYILLLTDPTLIGVMNGPVDAQYGLLITIYVVLVLAGVLLITGLIIAVRSLKSDIPEHKLRGLFLIIALISFVIGASLDSSMPLTFITLTITRLILISSAFEFYCGFVLPNWIKKIFLKEK
ncbi:MAG: hypothetical protein ACFFAH_07980 [Promethearchaeota archaeon]